MTFAASAASGFALNASECGTNGSSKLGNRRLFEHTLLRVATEPAIMVDNSRRVEVIAVIFSMLQVCAGGGIRLEVRFPVAFIVQCS